MSALVLSLLLLVLVMMNCNADFYSCPMVTSIVNQSIIHTNPYSCQSIDCSFIAALYRSKYICDQWPFYIGLFPKRIKSTYSSQCTNDNCDEWTSNQPNKNNCYCIAYNNNGRYCTHWYCDDTSRQNISDAIYKCNSNNNVYCPIDGADNQIFSNCYCAVESHTTNFCQRWYCRYYQQYQDINNDVYLKIEQTEWHKCISLVSTTNITQYGIYNGTLCFKWVGDVINRNKWSVNECVCHMPSLLSTDKKSDIMNAFCNQWNCTEIGMNYAYDSNDEIGLFWIWFIVFDIICAFVMCSYCGVMCNKYRNTNARNIKLKHKRRACLISFAIVNIIILPFITLFIGGFVNFLFYMATSILSFLIGCICFKHCWFYTQNKKKDSNQTEFSEYEANDEINSENEIKNMLSYSGSHQQFKRKMSIHNIENSMDIQYDEENDEDNNQDEQVDIQWIRPDGKIKYAYDDDYEVYDDNTTLITSLVTTMDNTSNLTLTTT